MNDIGILIREPGGEWRPPDVKAMTDESALQSLLVDSPSLIPGIEGPVVVAREMAIGSGFADIVAVSPIGEITIVECKLQSNPDIRRAVIGQAFEYASQTWDMRTDDFLARLANRIGSSIQEAFTSIEPEWSEATFRSMLSQTLSSGSFSVVFAVDQLTPELKRSILYLNQMTKPELRVMGFELDYVRDGSTEILIPRVYGEESSQTKRPSVTRPNWTEEQILARLDELVDPSAAAAFRLVFEHTKRTGTEFYFGDGKHPSVTAWFPYADSEIAIWSCYLRDDPSFDIDFQWMHPRAVPPEVLDTLIDDLHAMPGFDPAKLDDVASSGYSRRPGFPIGVVLSDLERAEAVIASFDRLLVMGATDLAEQPVG